MDGIGSILVELSAGNRYIGFFEGRGGGGSNFNAAIFLKLSSFIFTGQCSIRVGIARPAHEIIAVCSDRPAGDGLAAISVFCGKSCTIGNGDCVFDIDSGMVAVFIFRIYRGAGTGNGEVSIEHINGPGTDAGTAVCISRFGLYCYAAGNGDVALIGRKRRTIAPALKSKGVIFCAFDTCNDKVQCCSLVIGFIDFDAIFPIIGSYSYCFVVDTMDNNGNSIVHSGDFEVGICTPLPDVSQEITLSIIVNRLVG